MKRFFAILVIVWFSALYSVAQDEGVTEVKPTTEVVVEEQVEINEPYVAPLYKPQKGQFGLSFNVKADITNFQFQSFSDEFNNNSIFGRYYIKDDLSLRLGFGMTTKSLKNTKVDSLGTTLVQVDSTYKRADFYIAPGLEKHFYSTERLDPYAGIGFSFGSVGKAKSKSLKSVTDTSGTASGTSKLQIDKTESAGLLFGVNIMLGFNYFIAKNLSIGAEYRFGYSALKTGGETALVYTDTPVNGTETITREEYANVGTLSGLGISSSVGVTMSYFFGKPKN